MTDSTLEHRVKIGMLAYDHCQAQILHWRREADRIGRDLRPLQHELLKQRQALAMIGD